MRFLILNTDYPGFLSWLYAQHPGLGDRPYEEQMRARVESLFGVADFYSSNLRQLGHEAWDIHANNEFMQRAWSAEHGIRLENQVRIPGRWRVSLQAARQRAAKTPLRYLKPVFRAALRRLDAGQNWFYDILAAQVKHYKPDILLNQAMDGISSHFLKEMKPYVRLLVGQHASPLPDNEDFGCYALVISSLPNFVEYFGRVGVPAELHRLGFEPRILSVLRNGGRRTSISFVGSLSWHHQDRIQMLEYLCTRLGIEVWGQGADGLPQNSPIRRHYKGQAWGMAMYQILHNSSITLNQHIGVAECYANNMRLYEATGVGTLLITDWKVNLHEMFEPGEEVVAYRTPEECAELVQYYLEHEQEREAIARAGQQRTLQEHTYYHRMQELVDIVRKYL